jgi:hypothetical protein
MVSDPVEVLRLGCYVLPWKDSRLTVTQVIIPSAT